jgi:SAM-dependent methyltransferase
VGHEATRRIAAKNDGFAGGGWNDVFNVPMTAHFLGGAPIGADSQSGVIDAYHRVFGHPGLHVVDVGCGRGEAAAHAARRGAVVTALDYSPGSLALTRRTVAVVLGRTQAAEAAPSAGRPGEPAAPRVRLVAADATALPLAGGMADRVLLLDVVEHLHTWQLQAVLAEVRRILAPDGCVIVHTLPNRRALAAAYPVLRLFAPQLPPTARSGYEAAVHVNEQDPASLRRVLREAGFVTRVWVEEWTTRQAAWGAARGYPDRLRSTAYPLLGRPIMRQLARRAMQTPLREWLGNDIFALAWHPDGPEPPAGAKFRQLN